MKKDDERQFDEWLRTLPSSRMVFPRHPADLVKYAFWRFYTPYHTLLRDIALYFGVVSHEGRQDFRIGTVAPHQSIREFVSYLIEQGYERHHVAWEDEGELVSLRYAENFSYQYHIRVFADGEVRGHYEYTPECAPLSHMKKIGMEDRRHEFLALMSDRIVIDPEHFRYGN